MSAIFMGVLLGGWRQTVGRLEPGDIGRLFDLDLNAVLISRMARIGRAADAVAWRVELPSAWMQVIRRFVRADPPIVDGVFAAALAAVAEVEVWSGGSGSQRSRAVVAVLMTLTRA
jgi:hypothetical protein